ncbi:DNA-binding transcriptional LysR family regulator [Pseudoclavibacter chungangensis]|nr:LysR family transcriptional regulator [Pseudoclavibacter chungangensis]NYJ67124.1 DNA-binding transcriptional LysR family regulator [Pseudoclavibacter chungangensis]
MELRHLRAFVAVARESSFTAAASSLHVTQPALSRTVRRLEELVGVRLLERTTRSVTLTPAGTRFLARATDVFATLELALDEAKSGRELRLGFSWALPDPWFAECVEAFERSEGARVRVVRRDDIAAALARNEIDAALVRHEIRARGVRQRNLFDEPRVAAVSARSSLARRRTIDWDELRDHTIIVNTGSGSTRPELWAAGREPGDVVECGNYDEWITLVAADRGVGATPRSAASTYAHAGVVFVPLVDAPRVPLRLVRPADRSDELVDRFVAIGIAAHAAADDDGERAPHER